MNTHMSFSIKKKISALLLGVLVLALISVTLLSLLEFKTDKLQYIHDVNKAFTSTIAEKIQSGFEAAVEDIQNMLLITHSGIIDDSKADLLKKIFKTNPNFVSFSLFEKSPVLKRIYELQNKNYLSLYNVNDAQLLLLNRQAITAFMQGSPSEDHLYYLNQVNLDVITFVIPLKTSSGHLTVFNLSKEVIHRAIAESSVHESFVVDESGRIIAHNDLTKIGTQINSHPLFEFSKSNQLKEGSQIYYLGEHKKKYVGNFYHLDYGLILISQVDSERAFLGMQTIVINNILFAVIILSVTLIVGMHFSQTLTAPIRKLTHLTDYMSAGNYDVKIDLKTNDEVSQLAEHFINLGKKLSQREAELEVATDLATKDGLTGLYNHRYFQNQLNKHFKLAQRHNLNLTLVLIDIDHFKKINDTHGHQQGDKILKELASIILSTVRNTDIAARYGGEEFVVILPNTDKEGGVIIAERIRQNFRSHKTRLLKDSGYLQATISIGVATLHNHNYSDVDELIKFSDENLYEAKKTRDRVFAG